MNGHKLVLRNSEIIKCAKNDAAEGENPHHAYGF